MISAKFCALFGLTLVLLPSTLGAPIFWFPWNLLLPTTTTSGSGSSSSNSNSNSASSSSSATTMRPINASIAIGNRVNTNASIDMGTVIDGLTITRGRRSAQLTELPDVVGRSQTSDSFIQVGNQIIRLPPGDVANLTINIVDGVPYVFGNTAGAPSTTTTGSEAMTAGIFSQLRNFFGELFNRT